MSEHGQLPSCSSEPTLAQNTLVTSLEGVIEHMALIKEETPRPPQDARIISLVHAIAERAGEHGGDGISTPSSAAQALPTEVMLQVFDRLIPPQYLIDHTGVYCETSPFNIAKRQEKTLMQVCWSWHQIVKPLLYEHVVIRQHPQLFLLLESLQRTPSNASLVKYLYIACLIQEPWAGAFSNTLQRTIDCLDALLSFTFHAPIATFPQSFQLPGFPHGLSTLQLDPRDASSGMAVSGLIVPLGHLSGRK
ncbi:hypothetical protein BKA70DRAFT_646669 [Coprinopsis sp. MPI-PUGE-AT-0042]|nr:hypothetical protein BKA70DRAFT_646669 [Coprinopsis sp. MPI-PUGE-AT-0042]